MPFISKTWVGLLDIRDASHVALVNAFLTKGMVP